MYLSPDIQNDLFRLLSEITRDIILKKKMQAKIYSLIIDESRDCSRNEICSISMHFVTDEGTIEEVFLDFEKVTSTASENLFSRILQKKLPTWKLPVTLCRGQCYDDAFNMAEKERFTAAISRKNSTCCAHNLNLCLTESYSKCTDGYIRTLERLYSFFLQQAQSRSNHIICL